MDSSIGCGSLFMWCRQLAGGQVNILPARVGAGRPHDSRRDGGRYKKVEFGAKIFLVPDVTRLWTAIIVTIVFAALARWVRGVSFGGAIAGALVCFLLCFGAGFGAFVVLVSVFVLTWISTRFGYRRKQKLGTAEKLDGRTALQVLANLAVAAGCAGLLALTGRTVFLLAVSAALAEAAADTVSSELGQARSAKARLITNWEEVAAGTDGGVSWTGTLAGIAAAASVSVVSLLAGLVPLKWLGVSMIAAVRWHDR